jgi:hypothetical protein
MPHLYCAHHVAALTQPTSRTMSGAVNQAQPRSVDNQTGNETVTAEGWSFETQETDAKAIGKLKKPSCFGGIEAPRKACCGSSCNSPRYLLFRRIGEYSPHLQEGAERVILEERSNKLEIPDVAKTMLEMRVILTKFLWLDENYPSTGLLRSLVDCQQDLNNKAYNKACQNVKDKKESDIHKIVLNIPDDACVPC